MTLLLLVLKAVSFVQQASLRVLSAVEIIDIQILDQGHHLVIESLALRRVVDLDIHLVPVEDAAQGDDLVVEVLRDHAPVDESLNKLIVRIDVHVSNTVSDDETLEVVGLIKVLVHLLDEVPLVDLPSQVGAINSSVAFTRHEQGVSPLLRVGLIELLKSREGILTLREIGMQSIASAVG